jgi:hypothetical protein
MHFFGLSARITQENGVAAYVGGSRAWKSHRGSPQFSHFRPFAILGWDFVENELDWIKLKSWAGQSWGVGLDKLEELRVGRKGAEGKGRGGTCAGKVLLFEARVVSVTAEGERAWHLRYEYGYSKCTRSFPLTFTWFIPNYRIAGLPTATAFLSPRLSQLSNFSQHCRTFASRATTQRVSEESGPRVHTSAALAKLHITQHCTLHDPRSR